MPGGSAVTARAAAEGARRSGSAADARAAGGTVPAAGDEGRHRILVVEDEDDIRDLLYYNLTREGFRVSVAEDGVQALESIRREPPDLVLLDLMLPGLDGLELTRRLRREAGTAYLPVVMLTAKKEDVDRIVGLELGADDYVTKPFNMRELVLRLRAVLRRSEERAASRMTDVLAADDFLRVDLPRREVRVDGERVSLTVTEFKLLVHLLRERGRVQTRERLLREVWGYEYAGYDRTIDTHVARLRRKLRGRGDWIETAWGVGYRFRES
jgi:two-component system phosphate regulon response regulator PhoB